MADNDQNDEDEDKQPNQEEQDKLTAMQKALKSIRDAFNK